MIVLLKYKAVSDGKLQKNAWMNLTEVRALEFAKDVHIDIEEWISRNSLDEVQELNSQLIARIADSAKVPTLILFMDRTDASIEIF